MSTGIVQRRRYNNTEEATEEQPEELKEETSHLTLMEEILLLGLKDNEVHKFYHRDYFLSGMTTFLMY
jgi:hypothetical protein